MSNQHPEVNNDLESQLWTLHRIQTDGESMETDETQIHTESKTFNLIKYKIINIFNKLGNN